MKIRFLWLGALIAAFTLVAASCGADDSASNAGGEIGGVVAPDAGAAGPAFVELVDVGTGETTSLNEALYPGNGNPTLAFFWAPFCPSCRVEAPELDDLAASHGDEINIVGIGTRDDLAYAEEFLESTGVENFPLLWEESGQSWQDFGVIAQPYLILLDDGQEVQRWPGGATDEMILSELSKLT